MPDEVRTPGLVQRGPLRGLRVVDLTTSYAGPTASMYLADLGADVIKVEKPRSGDDGRGWGPPFVEGWSAWFASANRNKRSLALDLRAAEGLRALHDLVSHADVFIQNVNPSKLERLGVDPETLCALRPSLIYCAMSGFGLDGPAYAQPGYDLAAQARSGLMSVTGPKGGAPQRVSTALSDVVTGMCAAMAISAAVVPQRCEDRGDVIDVSLLDSDLALMAPRIAAYLAGEEEPMPSGGTDSVLSVYQSFPTADRDIIVAIGNDAMWQRFCLALGLHELVEDEQLSTNAGRREHRPRIIDAIGDVLRERSATEWLSVLNDANVPASFVQSLSEVVGDEQVAAREALMPVPGVAGLFTVHSPFRLASIGSPRNQRAPYLGEHSHEILTEFGFDESRIESLLTDGVVEKSGIREEVRARG